MLLRLDFEMQTKILLVILATLIEGNVRAFRFSRLWASILIHIPIIISDIWPGYGFNSNLHLIVCLFKLFTYYLFVCFIESRSNSNETRLRKRLFDPEYQKDDLTTTPITSVNDVINVNFSINILKLITLVKAVDLMAFNNLHISEIKFV